MNKLISIFTLLISFGAWSSTVDTSMKLVRSSCDISSFYKSYSELQAELSRSGQFYGKDGLVQFVRTQCLDSQQVNRFLGFRNSLKQRMENTAVDSTGVGGELITKNEPISPEHFTDKALNEVLNNKFLIQLEGRDCKPITCYDYLKLKHSNN